MFLCKKKTGLFVKLHFLHMVLFSAVYATNKRNKIEWRSSVFHAQINRVSVINPVFLMLISSLSIYT